MDNNSNKIPVQILENSKNENMEELPRDEPNKKIKQEINSPVTKPIPIFEKADHNLSINTAITVKSEILPESISTTILPQKIMKISNCIEKKCEGCSKTKISVSFLNGGRFCSKKCVGLYALYSRRQRTAKLLTSAIEPLVDNAEIPVRAISCPMSDITRSPYMDLIRQHNGTTSALKHFSKSQKFIKSCDEIEVGMRLEGIDPSHQQMYVVLSVAQVCGVRLRLHFDGYPDMYDFWVNRDSSYIFPAGWCDRFKKKLQTPGKAYPFPFKWATYLKFNNFTVLPERLFTTKNEMLPYSGFNVGDKLETVDRMNAALTCVSSVRDTFSDKILIHFDGWSDIYDFWCDASSPYIHPVGWCQENFITLSPPKDENDVKNFTWKNYLKQTNSSCVPVNLFLPREPANFEIGDFLEIVDIRNPVQIRLAHIVGMERYKIKLHYEGWNDEYDSWIEDHSANIHPLNWSKLAGCLLENPYGNKEDAVCPTPSCNGIGHVKGPRFHNHHRSSGCPYSSVNMNKDDIPDRLNPNEIIFKNDMVQVSPVAPLPVKVIPVSNALENLKVKMSRNKRPLFGPGSGRGRKRNFELLVNACINEKQFNEIAIMKDGKLHSTSSQLKNGAIINGSSNCGANGGIKNGANGNANSCNNEASRADDTIGSLGVIASGGNTEGEQPLTVTSLEPYSNQIEVRPESSLVTLQSREELNTSTSQEDEDEEDEKKEVDDVDKKEVEVEQEVDRVRNVEGKQGEESLPPRKRQRRHQSKQNTPNNCKISTFIHKSVINAPKSSVYETGKLPFLWTEHSKLLSIDHSFISDAFSWSLEEVCNHVNKLLNSDFYTAKFREELIDGHAFMLLTMDDLKNCLGLKLGPALKIANSIMILKNSKFEQCYRIAYNL